MIPHTDHTNTSSVPPSPKAAFDEMVKHFASPQSGKKQILDDLKNGIALLRRKGASYREISKMLQQAGFSVSHETVARYCRCVMKLPIRKSKPKKPLEEVHTPEPVEPTSSHPHPTDTFSDWPRERGGPRITDHQSL